VTAGACSSTSLTDSQDAPLVAGRIGRPHGLDGSFHVVEADARLLPLGAQVVIDGVPTEIVGRKGTDKRPILKLALAVTREAVEVLSGRPMLVARRAAPELASDEYWATDLVGCDVVAGDRALGRVESMRAYPSCEVLEVGELLVPLVRDAIRSIDVDARRIEVDPRFLGLESEDS
jgi:16S rRNA processing protein RimM